MHTTRQSSMLAAITTHCHILAQAYLCQCMACRLMRHGRLISASRMTETTCGTIHGRRVARSRVVWLPSRLKRKCLSRAQPHRGDPKDELMEDLLPRILPSKSEDSDSDGSESSIHRVRKLLLVRISPPFMRSIPCYNGFALSSASAEMRRPTRDVASSLLSPPTQTPLRYYCRHANFPSTFYGFRETESNFEASTTWRSTPSSQR